MAESLATSADATTKDKRPNSGSSEGKSLDNNIEDMADWERRLVEGDLPEDFLEVTEPSAQNKQEQTANGVTEHGATADAATGLLVDIPTVTSSNSVPQDHVPPPKSLQAKMKSSSVEDSQKPMSTEESDRALALELQKQLDLEANQSLEADPDASQAQGRSASTPAGMVAMVPANVHGRLTVTVAEAKLAKNYGMSRMDPYCRVRIGHSVYETPTSANGAREPKWNKTFHVYLLKGTKNIDIEIYDECTFTNDAMVAHSTFSIPEDVFKFMVVDDWFPLSGQEGHEKEGVLHLILSLQPLRAVPTQHMMEAAQPKLPTEEQLLEMGKMFPNLDKDIISSVFVEKSGSQEEVINVLLQMSSE